MKASAPDRPQRRHVKGYGRGMSTAHQLRYSYEDYLRALAESPFKLEYSAGVIYAMAGGAFAHGELSVRVASLVSQQLADTCHTYSSDVKVRVDAIDFAAFPDVSAGCGPRLASRVDANALTNPVLLVEVTSRSTEAYDRGEKLEHYQLMDSLQAVVFVSHREARLTLVARTLVIAMRQDADSPHRRLPAPHREPRTLEQHRVGAVDGQLQVAKRVQGLAAVQWEPVIFSTRVRCTDREAEVDDGARNHPATGFHAFDEHDDHRLFGPQLRPRPQQVDAVLARRGAKARHDRAVSVRAAGEAGCQIVS